MSKSALIFGASGVTGWAFVNEILNDYPKKGVWKNVYALTNRPLSREDSEWPSDPRLNIVSGIDLLEGGQSDLERELENGIKGLGEVTHVYYLGMFDFPLALSEWLGLGLLLGEPFANNLQHTKPRLTSPKNSKTQMTCSNVPSSPLITSVQNLSSWCFKLAQKCTVATS